MNRQIKLMQDKWTLRETTTQAIVFEEKAINLHDMHLKRRWFNELMRNILICACARRIRTTIEQRDKAYLRQVSFLVLKQEMVLGKHLRQVQAGRSRSLMQKTVCALRRNLIVSKMALLTDTKENQRRKATAFESLRAHIVLAREERSSKAKATEFKEFNLKLKAWTVFMKYFSPGEEERFYSNSMLDLSKSLSTTGGGVKDYSIYDLAEQKRISTLFGALKYGIRARKRSLLVKEKAFSYLYDSLLKKAFLSLRSWLARSRKCRKKATQLRKVHLRNLVVKSFSSLLFHAEGASKKKHLDSACQKFTKQMLFRRWKRWKARLEQGEKRAADFRKRWGRRTLHRCLCALSQSAFKNYGVSKKQLMTA